MLAGDQTKVELTSMDRDAVFCDGIKAVRIEDRSGNGRGAKIME